jgi:YesN/AraC family two-component response regulator
MNTDKITLIILDDDFSSRNTIKNIIRMSRNYFVVDSFSDAKSALEWLKDNKIDIAICDMNMPNIDGIEFITQALGVHPDLRFLAISAYSDFRYLRECMINSVEDYLLKHELTNELLINTLDKIKDKYNMKPYLLHAVNVLHNIDQDSQFTDKNIKDLIKNGSVNFTVDTVVPIIISPDYNSELFPNYAHFSDYAIFAIKDIICNVLDNRYSYILHKHSSSQFALLLSFPCKENNHSVQNKMKAILSSIKDKVSRLLNVTLTVGYSITTMNLEAAIELLGCLNYFKECKLYMSPGGSFVLNRLQIQLFNKYTLPPYIKEQMKTLIELKDFPSLKELIRDIFVNLAKKQVGFKTTVEISEKLYNLMYSIISQNEIDKHIAKINFHDYEFIQQFENMFMNFIDNFIRNIKSKTYPAYSTVVVRSIFYIENHYKEAISLESCAEEVGISYAHLSRIFKKETAFSFSEYLNRFRVSKAKMLLAERKLAIKQIVEEAGFTNYNYFFRVFKDIEGITPVEYTDSANN